MKFARFFLFMFCWGIVFKVMGHPVSFKGSKGIMGYHSSELAHNQINYSFKHWLAAGIHHIRRTRLPNADATFLSFNFLAGRWNASNLQANVYTVIGAGKSRLADHTQDSAMAALQFDIEDRDYYFLTKHLRTFGKEKTDFEQSIVRLGFAPYVDGFDGIHSWLILEWQNLGFAGEKNVSDLTPFLRVFYKNLLFEMGLSFNGVARFNYITHF